MTVYSDRADVRREASGVVLEPGENRVRFEHLPPTLLIESVRASGSGAEGVRIVNVDLERVELGGSEAAHPRAEELAGLQAELRRLEAKRTALQAGGEFLQSVRVRLKEDAAGLATSASADPDDLKTALGFLLEEVGANHAAKSEVERSMAKTRESMRAVERDISSRSVRRDALEWTATLELHAESSREVALQLDYSVVGARWTPQYDVFVSSDLERIELVYAAEVSQSTGEDWDDVRIELSSAEPSLGAQMPELSAWRLSVPEVQVAAQGAAMVRGGRSTEVKTAIEMGMASIDTRSESKIRAINTTEETIATIGIPPTVMEARVAFASTVFEIPTRQSLPSDGRARRMRVAAVPLTGEVTYESVPKLSAHAYMVASVVNGSELPLLPGETRVTFGGQFLGKGAIENVAPGQKFSLALGVDRSVEIERKVLKDETGPASHDRSRERREVQYRIEVTNHRSVPVTVTVHDQLPLSPEKDVDVETRKIVPEPLADPDHEGALAWKLELPAGESRQVSFAYEVRYPTNRRPRNL
ncbi:MAG: mucoidy inhibitor MuiA family protein [bacterium]